MAKPKRIGLREAIAGLRTELIESVKDSQGEQLRFELGEITMEFQIEVERSIEANGGLEFYVVKLGAGGTEKAKDVHKVVIPLKPVRYSRTSNSLVSVLTGSDEIPE